MDIEYVGREGKPYRMVVEMGKIREFARAVSSDNPEYFSEAPVSPPTFLASAGLWADGPENAPWGEGVNLERVVHGEQEYVFHGAPPAAGERLSVQTRVDRIYDKEGRRGGRMRFAELVTEYRDVESGALRAESRSTLIETGQSIK
jgi:hypothetical protein